MSILFWEEPDIIDSIISILQQVAALIYPG